MQRNLDPFRLALRANPQFVRLAPRIVEEKAELGVRRALGPVEAELRDLMLAAEGVVMVDRHRRADLVSIIEDRGRAGLGHVRRRVPNCLGVHAGRVAEEAADEIEIVDRMHGDLDPRQTFQEGEHRPGRQDRKMNLDINEAPEEAAVERVPDRKHHRREAQLEIDCRGQFALAANFENRGRRIEIGAHRLLDEDVRAHGNALEHGGMSAGRRRQIEDRVFRRQGLIERAEDLGHAEFGGDAARPRRVEVIDASDRKAGLPIGGEMSVDDDRARADRDDRLRM